MARSWPGVNDEPAEGEAFADPGSANADIGPIVLRSTPPAMLADEKAREAKYGRRRRWRPPSPPWTHDARCAYSSQPPTASGRPRIFDASEGTRLDPLLNKTYDLSYAKVVPPMQ